MLRVAAHRTGITRRDDIAYRVRRGQGALAFLPEQERRAIQSKNAKEYRRYKLTGEKVGELVEWTRENGYAFNPGLVLPGVYGVGVPVYREGTVVASISVAAIEQRLNRRRRAEVVGIVRSAVRPLKGFDTSA